MKIDFQLNLFIEIDSRVNIRTRGGIQGAYSLPHGEAPSPTFQLQGSVDSVHSFVTIYFESYKNTLGKKIGEQRVQHRV